MCFKQVKIYLLHATFATHLSESLIFTANSQTVCTYVYIQYVLKPPCRSSATFVQGWVCAHVRQICATNVLGVEYGSAHFMPLQSVTCVCLCERTLTDVHTQGKPPLASLTLTSRRFPPTV